MVSGALCRVLFYSSLIFGAQNTAVLELSTPYYVAPNGIFLCMTAQRLHLQPSNFSIISIKEGGDQFDTSETELLIANAPLPSSPFFSASAAQFAHRPAEFGTVWHVLGTDPFFASSYSVSRYDDFVADVDGRLLDGVVAEDKPAMPTGNATSTDGADADVGRHNCVLISASWRANTRYEITLSFQNPPAASSPPRASSRTLLSEQGGHGLATRIATIQGRSSEPALSPHGITPSQAPLSPMRGPVKPERRGGPVARGQTTQAAAPSPSSVGQSQELSDGAPSAAPVEQAEAPGGSTPSGGAPSPPAGSYDPLNLGIWMAPISYSLHDEKHLLYRVRGEKYGHICPPAERLDVRLRATSASQTAPSAAPSATSATRTAISKTQSTDDSANAMPTWPERTLHCPRDTVLSPRYGGECVRCQGGVISLEEGNSLCSCPPSSLRNKIGEEACGAKRSPGGAESPSGVALEICTHFVSERTKLLNGNLSDIIVAEEYVSLFADMASSILDTYTVIQANETFVKEMMFDVRRPWYPTRATGLLPNCIRCRNGNFRDMRTNRMVLLSDHRYASMNVFRLIGYVLHLAGYNCPALYNPGDTSPSNYGPYKDSVCG